MNQAISKYSCADLEWGSRGSGPPNPSPLEFAKLNIADITGNEKKNNYFSYLCTSTVIRQGWTPLEKISGSSPEHVSYVYSWHNYYLVYKDVKRTVFNI